MKFEAELQTILTVKSNKKHLCIWNFLTGCLPSLKLVIPEPQNCVDSNLMSFLGNDLLDFQILNTLLQNMHLYQTKLTLSWIWTFFKFHHIHTLNNSAVKYVFLLWQHDLLILTILKYLIFSSYIPSLKLFIHTNLYFDFQTLSTLLQHCLYHTNLSLKPTFVQHVF